MRMSEPLEWPEHGLSLYHVQDADRPMHVVAATYGEAVLKWEAQVKKENVACDAIEPPQGIALVCEPYELLLPEPIPEEAL